MSSPSFSFSRPLWGHLGGNTTFPSRDPKSPLTQLLFCFKAFSSMDVNRVSVKESAFLKHFPLTKY